MLTETMRTVNVVVDLYSIIISLMLGIYLKVSGGRRKKLNTWFSLMCFLNISLAVGDMSNWICEGFGNPWNPFLLWAGQILYYVSICPLMYSFCMYIAEYLREKTVVSKWFQYVQAACCIVYTILVIISQFNGMIYYIDAGNYYHRGDHMLLSQIIAGFCYVICAVLVQVYRKCLSLRAYLTLLSYIVVPVSAHLVQFAHYGYSLLNPAITVTLLLIFFNVQSEQELLLKEREAQLIQSRIDIMISQIQPHFLFNTLTVIRQLCENNPAQAKQALLDFSRFLRGNMDSLTNKDLIPFEQELKHVKHYLNLEKQRFQHRLSVVYEIEEKDFHIPPLTLQPLVENAVRHGIMKREEGGQVLIRTRKEKNQYVIEICDDGIGFENGTEKQLTWKPTMEGGIKKTHVGIENVRNRLEKMCRGSMEITSVPGKGTTVTIKIQEES